MVVANAPILIIDDDPGYGASVRDLLATYSYQANFTENSQEGLELLKQDSYQVLILDLNMPETSGMNILEELAATNADVKTIVLSGEPTLNSVTPILRLGAYDYLQKPFEPQQLLTSVTNALDHYQLEKRNRSMASEVEVSHELHEFLVNSTPDIIYMLDEDGNFNFINKQLHNIFKVKPEDLQGHPWERLLGDRLATILHHRFNERRTGSRATRNYEFDFLAPDGQQRIMEFSATGLYDDHSPGNDGRFVGTYGVLRDVTQSRLTARKLEQSQQKFYSLFMDSPDAVFITRVEDGHLIEGNDNFRRIKHAVGAGDLESDAFIFPSPESRQHFVQALKETPSHFRTVIERDLSGQTHFFEVSARILELEGEDCMIGTLRDRTQERVAESDRLNLQNQLQQATKMEALGQLAGGIAHDFNNILASIIGYAELVLTARERFESEQIDAYLGEVITAGHRARDLISQMLTFTRANRGDPCSVDIVEAINDVSRMLRAAIPTSIDINSEYEDDLPPVMADPVQLQQVILNLMINARDAISGNGSITLKLSRGHQDVPCTSCTERLHGEHIVLSVTDTGHGIPEELRTKVFEMYFTTREPGKGTGFGLWLINNLIHEYDGHISLESTVGQGTTFHIHLPIAEPLQSVAPEETLAAASSLGPIVVVDDEVSLSNFIGEVLRDSGHNVVIFNESPSALRYMETHGDEVSVMITDQAMPVMTGLELSEHVKKLYPDLPIILITAFTASKDTQRMERIGIGRFLAKPFRIDELMDAISELTLDSVATASTPSFPVLEPDRL